jgi:exonuclease SbcC
MITRLYLDGCFRHQDVTFEFHKGLTGITGQNESGKSLIVEMVRYALFGTAALRGAATDYKDLHVELDFEVKGQSYSVIRKKGKADLVGIATGTKPVNEAIQNLLGYDLLVFDVANACNQGQVEALSNMRPGERKAMVDKTIGLDVLDRVIEFCGVEANVKRKEAAAFERAIFEPQAPVRPENYRPTSEIEKELTKATEDLRLYQQAQGALAHAPQKPERPKSCPVKDKLPVLHQKQKDREYIEQQIEVAKGQLRSLRLPYLSEAEINKLEADWHDYTLWTDKHNLLALGENECPECGHCWPYEAERLKLYEDVVEVPKPAIDKRVMAEQHALLQNVDLNKEVTERIEALTASLEDHPSQLEAISLRRRYETDLANYEVALDSWKQFNAHIEERQQTVARLEGISDRVADLTVEFRNADVYERDKARYDRELHAYQQNKSAHQQMLEEAEAYATARKNIQALKIQVKTHLLPSLNKVASLLLNQMTGGERSDVFIDENFDIQIDGQGILTLSGSGKAVANLAIRIALGQILTNRVFSVFLADEVDAAMDDERAVYTADALRRLTDNVGQVVLVTHKSPTTDYMIELRK